MDSLDIRFRGFKESDRNMILSDWLRSHQDGGDWPHLMRARDYYDVHKHAVAKFLDTSETILAVDPEDEDHVFGWLVHSGLTLHYMFTRRLFRRAGVARRLFDVMRGGHFGDAVCSHWTHGASTLRQRGFPLRYYPFFHGAFA